MIHLDFPKNCHVRSKANQFLRCCDPSNSIRADSSVYTPPLLLPCFSSSLTASHRLSLQQSSMRLLNYMTLHEHFHCIEQRGQKNIKLSFGVLGSGCVFLRRQQ